MAVSGARRRRRAGDIRSHTYGKTEGEERGARRRRRGSAFRVRRFGDLKGSVGYFKKINRRLIKTPIGYKRGGQSDLIELNTRCVGGNKYTGLFVFYMEISRSSLAKMIPERRLANMLMAVYA